MIPLESCRKSKVTKVFKSLEFYLFLTSSLILIRLGSGPIPFRDRDWKKHDRNIKDLIVSCLEMDPLKRIQSDEAL